MNGGSPATVVIDSCDGSLMVSVVALLTGVCGGSQKLMVVPCTICADCSLVISEVFLLLRYLLCGLLGESQPFHTGPRTGLFKLTCGNWCSRLHVCMHAILPGAHKKKHVTHSTIEA